ncbi:SAUR-like auxin-responsive family protein [Trifolium pratense]|uniref:SAUR-like auxin-responsive family protein n=2 Tax=Trifolium pratense TaxID=57577 RepID=A0A2K3LQT1_TRIPR|nr:SAUR-like auxin-responsive family protein [Trifolium pratense]
MLSSFIGKVQKSLSLFVPKKHTLSYLNEDHATATDTATTELADDVMKGCFAVMAKKGEETRRFIVGLDYLTDPTFLGLLDEAVEEYGFRQKGTLVVPCRPIELQNILDGRKT